ncbi:hypothetical protein [Streptomyces sp. CB09001]|uniref:hypothetical protein n=1 Tax=Streptomyces sp. CB09001 TaxID=2083284 RepID=UPI0013BE9003|nr:hypothetical protein [Streptomyces sp. CB09001]
MLGQPRAGDRKLPVEMVRRDVDQRVDEVLTCSVTGSKQRTSERPVVREAARAC